MAEPLLIVNADDFGLTEGVSRAILRAGNEGIVTSTSALANSAALGPFSNALRDSGLGVGAHLALVGHQGPVLAPSEVPTLVDDDGRLASAWRPFLTRCALGRVDLDDVRRELTAQVEALRAAGLTLSHVDTHQNLHLWPGIARATIEVAQAHRIPAIRVTRSDGRSPIALAVRHFAKRLESRARAAGMAFPDAFAGFDEAGGLDLTRLRDALGRLARHGGASAELVCHPSGPDDAELTALGWGYRGDEELAALVSPDARASVTDAGFRLGTFADLVDDGSDARPGAPPKDPQARRQAAVVLTEPPRDGEVVAVGEDPVRDVADTRWLVRRAAILYIAVAIALTGVVAFAIRGADTNGLVTFDGGSVLGGWCRFDCGWYLGIVDHGYFMADPPQQSSVAYFPGYPMVTRPLADLVDNTPLALIVVTWLSGFATLLLFARWCASRLQRRTAMLAVGCFALYPYAWYLYGAGYGDALFLALAIGAFLLLEDDHPLLAGVAGAAASVTRPIGIAVAAGLLLRAIELRGGFPRRDGNGWLARLGLPARMDVRRLHRRDLGVLLAPVGLVAWSGYLWARFDDPFAYSTVQAAWDQATGPRTWFKISFAEELLDGTRTGYRNIIQGLVVLVAIVAVPWVARRISAAYAGYVLLAVALPAVSTRDFQGMGRYILGAFPLFALAGLLLSERPRLRIPVLAASGALLVVGAYGFARNWYLS